MANNKPCAFRLLTRFALAGVFVLGVPLWAQSDEGKPGPGPACRPYLDFDFEFDAHDPGNIADCIAEMRTRDYQLAQKIYERILKVNRSGGDSDFTRALRSALQPTFIQAAIAAEFGTSCDRFRTKSGPITYASDDDSFKEFARIVRCVEQLACVFELEARRPQDFRELETYLEAIVDAGLVPSLDDVWITKDGAYLDAALRHALTRYAVTGPASK